MEKLRRAFFRTKHFTQSEIDSTALKRKLSTLDLTALGVGNVVGAGIYVIAGIVARDQTGPAIVISFAIGALVCCLSGLCFAEVGARVPRAGSAYIYSYVVFGELCAFMIGWMQLVASTMGIAAEMRAWSENVNSLCNDSIKVFFMNHVGHLEIPWLSEYVDFLAFGYTLFLVLITIWGVSQSNALNWFFTILNISVLVFVIISGLTYADTKNWKNFAPFGLNGILSGTSTLFFAFCGFEVIATSGEEAKNPRKAIPRSIISVSVLVTVLYECLGISLTLMIHYSEIPETSSLATSFDKKDFSTAKYIVAAGALCALSTGSLNEIYQLSRVLYAIAHDGLVFGFLAKINKRTRTPAIGCLVFGSFIALLSLIFEIKALADVLSISSLCSYTAVCVIAVLLRYKPGTIIQETSDITKEKEVDERFSSHSNKIFLTHQSVNCEIKFKNAIEMASPLPRKVSILKRIAKRVLGSKLDAPNEDSYLVVKTSLTVFFLSLLALESCLFHEFHRITSKQPFILLCTSLFFFLAVAAVVILMRQPQSQVKLDFKMPFMPLLPVAAISFNVALILHFSAISWGYFGIFLALGLIIYLTYGVRHSKENKDIADLEKRLNNNTKK
ncbi:cationic amino acid transporter 2-like [Xenia sp. Carnegie-2017]|uniref:cationic amino acid transporter 2-like n=1 Tax=Xenia sp. Carnegie-2017 TaxID=2897299 RepID=UPI001F04722D|nr:cationic amino acid transporter 2-like [Xenia sp. Carnegie-2017]XP_046850946.1 cationic amino acid transporter 2-like [Xenia sp. Carnegie-2017]